MISNLNITHHHFSTLLGPNQYLEMDENQNHPLLNPYRDVFVLNVLNHYHKSGVKMATVAIQQQVKQSDYKKDFKSFTTTF